MTFLVADCVSKTFYGRHVLSSATLRAVRGKVGVLFGRNGSGKSTLVKIAVGWIPADTGIVRVDGQTLMNPSLPDLARRGVFYLPDHEVLSPAFTLGEQLGFYEEKFGAYRVHEAARLANVEQLLSRKPHNLSGGELRRAELALAIVRHPSCLIADEPYRGIAPVDHDKLTTIFRALAADGCAVVVTGHEVPSLMEAADHVTWCTSGTTHELGSPAQAHENFAFVRDYLGDRYAG